MRTDASKEKRRFFHSRLSIRKNGVFASYINVLIGYMDTVVLYNLFFLATSLGLITIGPGLQAMVDGFEDIVANRSEKRYRAYFRHFKEEFNLHNILLGLLETGLLAAYCYIFLLGKVNLVNFRYMVIFMVIAIWLFFLTCRFFSYYHLQSARIQLPVSTILKNSFYFSVGNIKSALIGDLANIAFLMLGLFFAFYTNYIYAYAPLYLLITFSATSLSLMMSEYQAVDAICIKGNEIESDEDPDEVKEDHPHLRLDLINKKDDKNDKKA